MSGPYEEDQPIILLILLSTHNISTFETSIPFLCKVPGFMKIRIWPAAALPQALLRIRLIGSTHSESTEITTTGVINVAPIGGSSGSSRQRENRPGLYAPAPVSGSLSGSPDSNGVILELDYFAPWKYAIIPNVSLQYIIYNQFNGAGTNYDGFGQTPQTTTHCTS